MESSAVSLKCRIPKASEVEGEQGADLGCGVG
jgi:hypothetical protein